MMAEPRQHFKLTDNAIEQKFTRPSYTPDIQERAKVIEDFFKETALNISPILENGRYKNMMMTSLEEAMHWALRAMEMEYVIGDAD